MEKIIIQYLNLTYPNKLTFSQSYYHNKSIVFRHGDNEIGMMRSDMDYFIRINNQTHKDISIWFGNVSIRISCIHIHDTIVTIILLA